MILHGYIKHDGGIIPLKASAYAAILYKNQFGAEYFDDISRAGTSLKKATAAARLIWCLAKCANEDLPPFGLWIEELGGGFDLPAAASAAAALFAESFGEFLADGESDEETDEDEDDNTNMSEMLAAHALFCGFSVADLKEVTPAFVLRAINERIDIMSGEPKARKATQADIDALAARLKS